MRVHFAFGEPGNDAISSECSTVLRPVLTCMGIHDLGKTL